MTTDCSDRLADQVREVVCRVTWQARRLHLRENQIATRGPDGSAR